MFLPEDSFQDCLYKIKNKSGNTRMINGDRLSPLPDSHSYHLSRSKIPYDISFVSSDTTLMSCKSLSSAYKSVASTQKLFSSASSTLKTVESVKVKAIAIKLVENKKLLKRFLMMN